MKSLKTNSLIVNIVGDGLVRLATNVNRIFGFNYATFLPKQYQFSNILDSSKKSSNLTLLFYVVDELYVKHYLKSINNRDIVKISEHCYVDPTNRKVLCSRYTGAFNLEAIIEIKSDRIKVLSNKYLYNIVRLRIGDVYPPGVHLNTLTYLKLLEQDNLTLHGAALDKNNNAILLLAHSNVGKTLTSFLLTRNGFKLLGDDILVVNIPELLVYSVPYAQTFHHNTFVLRELLKEGYIGTLSYLRIKIALKIANAPIVPFYLNINSPPSGIYCWMNNNHKTISKLKAIFILKRSIDNAKKYMCVDEDLSDIAVELARINHIEFKWLHDPIVHSLDIIERKSRSHYELLKRELHLIENLLRRTQVFIVNSNNPFDYHRIISKIYYEYLQ